MTARPRAPAHTITPLTSSSGRAKGRQSGGPALAAHGATETAPEHAAAIRRGLLDWYRREQRRLPWRGKRDGYSVWVSEVMLQQTQVATVIDFYERWMRRFPTVAALASADLEDVLRAWEGLGYYRRARNLWNAARELMQTHDGSVPQNIAELRRLPGIGAYSAGAIASIAFGADEPAVDGNIMRVLTRLFAISGDPRKNPTSDRLWRLARQLLPPGEARDFNQALMELGATLCTPKSPSCPRCPVAGACRALRLDRVLEFPQTPARPKLSREHYAVAVIQRRKRVLVARLGADAARWANMWQFPAAPLTGTDAKAELALHLQRATGLGVENVTPLMSLEHQVTRFRINLDVFSCRASHGRAQARAYAELRWCTPVELAGLPMPSAHRKIARSLA